MADATKTKVILTTKGDNYYGEFDGKYFYMFPNTKLEKPDVIYWLICYRNKETLDKKLAGERVDGDIVSGVRTKQKIDDQGNAKIRLSSLVTDDENKKSWWANVRDNDLKTPGNEYDKYIEFTETEYRERQPKVEDQNLPF